MDFSSMSPADLTMIIVIIGGAVVAVGVVGLGIMISLFNKIVFMFENMGGFSTPKKSAVNVVPRQGTAAVNGVPGEVVAAISAAVSEVMGTGSFKIQSVRRKPEGRSPWGMAGALQNTKPF